MTIPALLAVMVVFILLAMFVEPVRKPALLLGSLCFCFAFADAAAWLLLEPRSRGVELEHTAGLTAARGDSAPEEGEKAEKNRSAESRRRGMPVEKHPELGLAPVPSNRILESKNVYDVVVYENVECRFDAKRRRVHAPTGGRPPEHALFFGGSYTFGEGLSNREMLSTRVQEPSGGRFEGFNFAFKGYGTSQMAVQLASNELFDDIVQPRGIAVYSFIEDHIYRTTGKPRYLAKIESYPLFRLAGDGSLEGPFRYGERLSYRIAMAVFRSASSASRFMEILLSRDVVGFASPERALRTTAAVVSDARRRYRERFDGEMFVLIWPRIRFEPELERLFRSLLAAEGIPLVRVKGLPEERDAVLSYRDGRVIDRHPSAKEVDAVAQGFLEALARFEAGESLQPESVPPAGTGGGR